ncbi:LRR receptor-like serine/threonine-protein kinase FLS2 [Abeliophyllum distichum]|uniref:non-specific serine/threonine protein kinase n=1 Tax=Abeliophyllum distichum TaxID=126358 RepID=A0ABD1STL2_9LAMI
MENSCLLILAINCFFAVCSAQTDQEALVAFKSRITFDPQNILAKNWSTGASVCNWIGVSCGVQHNRVTALNLSNFELEGTVDPHLGNLTFLRSLDISFNRFRGVIPDELSRLSRLKEIILASNNFNGNVPSWFGNLPKLEHMLLNYNSFTGIIPEQIGNLTSLESLDLKHNKLTGTVPFSIFNISSLQIVEFTNNSLHGRLPAYICDNLPKLEALYLSLNQLSGKIPSNLYKCKALQHLSVSYNQFDGRIPREIGELTMLKRLYLGGNNFEGGIPGEIGNLTHLEILSIRDCSITPEIPSFVFNMSSLKLIDFANSTLSGSLPSDLHYSLHNLEQLFLQYNKLTGQIFSSILECKRLWVLNLENNHFTGGIPKQVGNLTSLEYLYLNNNNLTGELPAELGNLNLVEINLLGNDLFGSIPPSIFNISTMTMLQLSSNHFVGQLPSNIGLSLPNLQTIYIRNNHFRGVIPSSIANASKLTVISMNGNLLTGPVPDLGNLQLLQRLMIGGNNLTEESPNKELKFVSSLTNCRYLEIVEISLNQFIGILPASIGNLSSSLRMFRAFGCNIKGPIPSEIGNLSSLESIDLDSNKLTGFIPSTLGKLNLEAIYLEHNSLSGYIPPDLCQLSKLGDLYLNANMLNGTIPACLGELKSLRRVFLHSNRLTSMVPNFWSLSDIWGLNLSSNLLSGYIPSEIQNLKAIRFLDLSRNQFSGKIPSSIGNILSVVDLSLAHNQFQGLIPQSLGDLRGLENLDLSYNKFSGTIPKSLVALKDLQYFDVSHNRLQGEIPTGGCFENFTAQSFMQNDGLCGADRLRVPPCKTQTVQISRSKHVFRLLKYVVAPILSVILGAAIIFLLIRRQKLSKKPPHTEISLGAEWRRVSYQELVQATDDFSEINVLGSGSFGSVFKGTFSDGLFVAVKVFNSQLERAIKSFEVECEVLSTIRHRNLVRVISCCSNTDFKALVLEYIPNGSLEKWLYSHNYCLDMLQRLNIAIDVALALEYLHHDQEKPIVHCDLKPSNVLLDEDMTARVGDFGISKLFGEEEDEIQTNTLATIGYMAPDENLMPIEYGSEGKVSTCSDVYSYGIMLLEMFTRKKPTDEMFVEEMSLKQWVSEALQNSINEVLATGLLEREDEHLFTKEQCVTSIFVLAMECSKNSPEERINMKETVAKLQKIKATFLASTRLQ